MTKKTTKPNNNCKFFLPLLFLCFFLKIDNILAASYGIIKCAEGTISNDTSHTLYIAKLTRRAGNDTGLYPMVKEPNGNVYTPKAGDDSYFGFGDITLDIEWPEAKAGKCPTTCRTHTIINTDFYCEGETDPVATYPFKNMFYILKTGKNKWLEASMNAETGILYFGENGERENNDVNWSKNLLAKFLEHEDGKTDENGSDDKLKCNASNKNNRCWFGGSEHGLKWALPQITSTWDSDWGPGSGYDYIDELQKNLENNKEGTASHSKIGTKAQEFLASFDKEHFLPNSVKTLKKSHEDIFAVCKEKIIANPDKITKREALKIIDKLYKNNLSFGKDLGQLYNYAKGSETILDIVVEEVKTKITPFKISKYTISVIENEVKPKILQMYNGDEKKMKEDLLLTDENIKKELEEYNRIFVDCLGAIEDSEVVRDFDDKEKNKLSETYNQLGAIGYKPIMVEDCSQIISGEFKDKINEYLNIISIIVAILVAVLGTVDFGTALLQSSEDDMKKSQAKLVKRLIIAAVIILTPTLVNFILSVANIIWGFISPNSCIKF